MPVRVEVGPRDLAEGNVTVVIRHRREKQTGPLAPWPATVARLWPAVGPELLAEADGGPAGPDRRGRTLDEAIEAGTTGFARIRLGALGPRGRTGWPSRPSRSAASSGPTGSLAEPGDAKTDLIAVVGRSY